MSKKVIKLCYICVIVSILFVGCDKSENSVTEGETNLGIQSNSNIDGYTVKNEDMFKMGRESYNKTKDSTELWKQQAGVVEMLGDGIKETASQKNQTESDVADYYYGILDMIRFYTEINLTSLKNNGSDEEIECEQKILDFIDDIIKNYNCDYTISDEKKDEYLSFIDNKIAMQENEENIYIKNGEISLKIKYGSFEQAIVTDETLVVKAKIKPSYSNKATIRQNSFNIEDIIKNQGGHNYKEIQYWAIADMNDGSESKVISFTIDEDVINRVANGSILGNEIIDYANDVWILPSLLD